MRLSDHSGWTLFMALALAGSASAEPFTPGREASVQALVGARVYVTPNRVLEGATVIIKDGRIAEVGVGLALPPEARRWDVTGKVIHAGFIDPFVTASRLQGRVSKPRAEGGEAGVGGEPPSSPVSSRNPKIRADFQVEQQLKVEPKILSGYREAGVVALQAVPDQGLFQGQAAIFSLKRDSLQDDLWRPRSAAVVSPLTGESGEVGERRYPTSLMGKLALVRQTLSDARHFSRLEALDRDHYLGANRPDYEASLPALASPLEGRQTLFFTGSTLLEGLSFWNVLREGGAGRLCWVLGNDAWRRLEWLDKPGHQGCRFVLTCNYPPPPQAQGEGEWLDVPTVALEAWRNGPAVPRWLHQRHVPFSFTSYGLKQPGELSQRVHLAVQAGLPPQAALAALTQEPARLLGVEDRLGTLERGKAASLVVRKGEIFESTSEIEQVWVEGQLHRVSPSKASPSKSNYPFHAEELEKPPASPLPEGAGSLLIQGAQVWTQGPRGVLPDCDVLVVDGKIRQIGPHLSAPESIPRVPARGLHLVPGLIDAHSHTAIQGDVNEGTLSVTSMVRVKDVINPLDRNIWLQLSGGVTTANMMHGSANAIGGQVITCKWKWGASPEQMIVAGAPEGIKFALGENPKRSWGERSGGRYPQTRLGVAELIRQKFVEARLYSQARADFAAGRRSVPVRTDFALEALVEILEGKRLIHCHSYRQDEILMLLRLAQEQGFKVATFQHVLEGYKVAPELAAAGSGASTFSDWWAYKIEVADAIPYNGNLMHERGVLTSFNSDSNELARRIWTEAPKAIRYGPTPTNLKDQEALAFLTINPARQLGIADRVGSIEPGKDADFALWSASPLGPQAVCLATYIEGRKYFDRANEARMQEQQSHWRASLRGRIPQAGTEAHP